MVLKEAGRRIPPALQLLLWCLALTLLVQLEFWRVAPGAPPSNPFGLSPIYWTLIQAFDAHGDWLLLAIAVTSIVWSLVMFQSNLPPQKGLSPLLLEKLVMALPSDHELRRL